MIKHMALAATAIFGLFATSNVSAFDEQLVRGGKKTIQISGTVKKFGEDPFFRLGIAANDYLLTLKDEPIDGHDEKHDQLYTLTGTLAGKTVYTWQSLRVQAWQKISKLPQEPALELSSFAINWSIPRYKSQMSKPLATLTIKNNEDLALQALYGFLLIYDNNNKSVMWNYGIRTHYEPGKVIKPHQETKITWDLRKIIATQGQELRLVASILYMYENETQNELFVRRFETKLKWEEARRDDQIPYHFTIKPDNSVDDK